MGDLGEGQTDTLDERMWGDDEDEEDGSDKEEESGQGMDQVQSKLWPQGYTLKLELTYPENQGYSKS